MDPNASGQKLPPSPDELAKAIPAIHPDNVPKPDPVPETPADPKLIQPELPKVTIAEEAATFQAPLPVDQPPSPAAEEPPYQMPEPAGETRFSWWPLVTLLGMGMGVAVGFLIAQVKGTPAPTTDGPKEDPPIPPGLAASIPKELIGKQGFDKLKTMLDLTQKAGGSTHIPVYLNAVLDWPEKEYRELGVALIATKWAEMDPLAAVSHAADEVKDPHVRDALMEKAFPAWARQEPEAAYRGSLEYREVFGNELALDSLRAAAATSPAETFSLASTISEVHFREEALREVTTIWARQEPLDCSRKVARLPTGRLRSSLMEITATQWAKQDPQLAMAWVRNEAEGDPRDRALASIVAQVGWENPSRAISLIKGLEIGRSREWAIQKFAPIWGEQDIEAATRWLESLPNDEAKLAAHLELGERWIEKDVRNAATYAANLNDEFLKETLLYKACQTWGRQDPNLAMAWARRLPEPYKLDAIESILSVWAETSPKAAAVYLDTLKMNDYRKSFVETVAISWARSHPKGAADWLDQLPSGSYENWVLGKIASAWMEEDLAAASSWILTFRNFATRDSAIKQIVFRLAKHDPRNALVWSSRISKSSLKNSQMREIFKEWFKQDKKEALEALDKSSLSYSDKQMLRDLVMPKPKPPVVPPEVTIPGQIPTQPGNRLPQLNGGIQR
ncbi:MAG: hypothetical protein AAF514_09015 [Verrucomicrobiota bacterium]